MVWRAFQYGKLSDIVRAAGTCVHNEGYSQIDHSTPGMAKRKDLDLFVYVEF